MREHPGGTDRHKHDVKSNGYNSLRVTLVVTSKTLRHGRQIPRQHALAIEVVTALYTGIPKSDSRSASGRADCVAALQIRT